MKKRILAFICVIAILMTGNLDCTYAEAAKKSVSLSAKEVTLKVGQTQKLKLKKQGKIKVKSKVFKSSNKKVATVTKKKGKIKAKQAGIATIKVKVKYIKKGSKKKKTITLKCKVTVTDDRNIASVKPSAKPVPYPTNPGSSMSTTPAPTEGNAGATPTAPLASENPTSKPISTPTSSPQSSPVSIPTEEGLYNASGDKVKTWQKLIEDKEVVVEDGILIAFNNTLPGILVISDSVTELWCSAFSESQLVAISIPGSIVTLGEDKIDGFYGCENLSTVRLGEGMETIAPHTFFGCSNLSYIDFPDSLRSIGYEAFSDTQWLKLQQQENDFVVVNDMLVCSGKKNSGEVVIPNGIRSIEELAFYGCADLTGVILPDGLQSIGDMAFGDCQVLSEIVLPESVQEVGNAVFSGTAWLEQNTKDDFAVINHVLISYGVKDSGKLILPEDITVIAGGAFSECENITGIGLPDGLSYIGPYAFYRCTSIGDVTIPAGVTVGEYAFYSCNAIKTVTIPASVTIGDAAFCECDAIESVKISANATIGDYVFSDCMNLSNVTMEAGIKAISNGLFSGCESLNSISIPDSVISIGDWSFSSCGLSGITIPSSVISIGDYAFYDCEKLSELQIPKNVSSIGNSAFYGIPLVMNNSSVPGAAWGADVMMWKDGKIPSAGLYDFRSGKLEYSWEELIQKDYIRVDKGVLVKGEDEDWNDGILTENFDGCLIISDTVTEIGYAALECSNYLRTVYIPGSVGRIEEDAFYYCDYLRGVVIAEGVTDIDEYAFLYCRRLRSISIPDSVRYIGEGAFSASAFKTITIPASVNTIGEDAFEGIPLVIYNGTAAGAPWGADKVIKSK